MESQLVISRSDWEAMRARVAGITDRLGMPVDEPIFELVVMLNLLGFQTTGSCGGHADRTTGGPYVVFESKKAQKIAEQVRLSKDYSSKEYQELRRKANYYSALEIQKMVTLLKGFYEHRLHNYDDEMIIVQTMPLTYNCIKCLAAETALTLAEPERERLVQQDREEMKAFADYLYESYVKE